MGLSLFQFRDPDIKFSYKNVVYCNPTQFERLIYAVVRKRYPVHTNKTQSPRKYHNLVNESWQY